jgi:hypothetical protein
LKPLSTIIFLVLLLLVTGTCDNAPTGELLENNPPSTFLTVGGINREGGFRLSSQINISWWGTDSDGYIVGYEYAINDTSDGSWTFTKKTDSTFILPIGLGLSLDDVLFKVRAIDDDGAVDADGARLVFPIVNSEPTVSLNETELPPDTLFSVASFGWNIGDPDGLGNILKTEIAINDTVNGWVEIPIPDDEDRLFISLQIDNTSLGAKEATVYQGRSYRRLPDISISGIEVGQDNTFFVRTTDNAGATSTVESATWFVKPQTSKTLIFNDVSGSNSSNQLAFHKNLLVQNGISPDIWIINDGEVALDKVALSKSFPAVIDPTLKQTLKAWDHIYWISNDIDRNITYALDITSEFFTEEGTMFVNIPMKGISQSDPVFNFLPVDSIGVLRPGQSDYQINGRTDVQPQYTVASGDTSDVVLRTRVRQTGIYPLKPISGSTPLYTLDFKIRTVLGSTIDYTGFDAVSIENPEGNLIYFSVDLMNLNENNNLDEMVNELLINRLGFKQ